MSFAPNGFLVHEGNLIKLVNGTKSTKQRHYVLQKEYLLNYSSKKDSIQKKDPIETIRLKGYSCSLHELAQKKKKFSFKLTSPILTNETLYFMTKNNENGNAWFNKLKQVLALQVNLLQRSDVPNSNSGVLKKHLDDQKESASLPTKVDQNKVYYLGDVQFLDEKSFLLQRYSCCFTSNSMQLRLVSDQSTLKTIEYSNLNSIKVIKGKENECKLMFKQQTQQEQEQGQIGSKQSFLLVNDFYQMLQISSIFSILQPKILDVIYQNGSISSKDKILKIFYPLLTRIFEHSLDYIQNLQNINFDIFSKFQFILPKVTINYLKQQDPMWIFRESSSVSHPMFSFIMIIQSICWRLNDPIFNINIENLSSFYNPEKTDEENIKSIYQKFNIIDTFHKTIIGGVFLLVYLLEREIKDSMIFTSILDYIMHLIHLFPLPSDNNLFLNQLKLQTPFIKFLIQKSPIIFNSTCKNFNEHLSGRKIDTNENELVFVTKKNNDKSNMVGTLHSITSNIIYKVTQNKLAEEYLSSMSEIPKNSEETSESGSTKISIDSQDFANEMSGQISDNNSSNSKRSENSFKEEFAKNKTTETKEIGSDNEEITSEESLLTDLHSFNHLPLPQLPISDKRINFLRQNPNQSRSQAQIIEYLFDEDCDRIWNIINLLETFTNPKNKKINFELFYSILESICFEISCIGIETSNSHTNFLRIYELITQNENENKKIVDKVLPIELFKSNIKRVSTFSKNYQKNDNEKNKSKSSQKTRFGIFSKKKKIK
ncbi:sesquipedalian [Anaeramoeba flamelloides]|uniref:Sesquipedalian n=1 Tax=Anaeramoeba flamelloides TaxID=1746091 RepID=A0AAV7YUA3_9EUKA|nr:sesquipedalian [Anaeramoeba flamelloides]